MAKPTGTTRSEICFPAAYLAFVAVVVIALLRITLWGDVSILNHLHRPLRFRGWLELSLWLSALAAFAVATLAAWSRSAVFGAAVAVACALFMSLAAPFNHRWLVGGFWLLVVACAVSLIALAATFTPRVLRLVAVVFVLGLVMLMTVIGRHQERDDQLADARATAASLDADLADIAVTSPEQAQVTLMNAGAALSRPVQAAFAAARSRRENARTDEARAEATELELIALKAKELENLVSNVLAEHNSLIPARVQDAKDALVRLTGAIAASTSGVQPANLEPFATKAADAILDLQSAQTASPLLLDAQTKIAKLCTAAGGMLGSASASAPAASSATAAAPASAPADATSDKADECPANSTEPTGDGTRLLTIKEAEAKAAVAGAQATSGEDADEKAQREAEVAVAAARTSAQQRPPLSDIVNFASTGADRVLSAAPGLRDEQLPTLVSAIGWAVIGVLAFAGFQVLQRGSARRSPGTMTVNDLANEADDNKPLSALFKLHVLRNTPEPPAIPGAVDYSAVTGVLETAAGAGGKLLGAIVTVLQSAVVPRSGYVVDATYLKPDATTSENGGDPSAVATRIDPQSSPTTEASHRVVVRIQSADTKAFVAGTTITEETAELAVRAAGYWAAGWVRYRTVSVASWLRWNERTAKALAVYLDDGSTPTREEMQDAARSAPDSGLVLTMLGYKYDKEGSHLDALGAHLRAATLYPRYPIARYRAAVSMSLVAADLDAAWWSVPVSERNVFVQSIRQLLDATGTSTNAGLDGICVPGPDDTAAVTALCTVSAEQLDDTAKLLDWLTVLDSALDREERTFWLRLSRHRFAEAFKFRSLVRSAALVSRVRASLDVEGTLDPLEQEANVPGSSWQLLYNLACFYAVRNLNSSDREKAVEWLERMLTHPGTEQITTEWLDTDPDLKSLKGDARFELIKVALPTGKEK